MHNMHCASGPAAGERQRSAWSSGTAGAKDPSDHDKEVKEEMLCK